MIRMAAAQNRQINKSKHHDMLRLHRGNANPSKHFVWSTARMQTCSKYTSMMRQAIASQPKLHQILQRLTLFPKVFFSKNTLRHSNELRQYPLALLLEKGPLVAAHPWMYWGHCTKFISSFLQRVMILLQWVRFCCCVSAGRQCQPAG